MLYSIRSHPVFFLAIMAPSIALVAGLNAIVCFGDWHGVSGRIAQPALPWTHLKWNPVPEFAPVMR